MAATDENNGRRRREGEAREEADQKRRFVGLAHRGESGTIAPVSPVFSFMQTLPAKRLGLTNAIIAAVVALTAATLFPWFIPRAAMAAPPDGNHGRSIPEPLRPWEDWATWDEAPIRGSPTPYGNAKKPLPFWPSRLEFQADGAGAKFRLGVTVFRDAWVPLPGGPDAAWPQEVRANDGGDSLAVVEHHGVPAVRLGPGTHWLEGSFRWPELPRGLPIPREIGLLALTVDGRAVETPAWDDQGFLWLRRDGAAEPADKDFLSLKLYAALEDGIPLWLRTEVELTVAGKSREEDLGTVLPEGWRLAGVESPLPVAVDGAGRMKAQVRAGKWTVRVDSFRTDDVREIRYPAGAKPAAEEQLVAFRARPDFRLVEITGAPSVDVSQVAFPGRWRELPVYRWETSPEGGTPLRIEERMRGMGQGKPAGLTVARELWLDEDGRGLTFRDHLSGTQQQIWRLDAAPGQDLGSVRNAAGEGQLITRNPQNAAPGVEIRTRAVDLKATGRMGRRAMGASASFPAVGWQTDAESLNATLNLPPGWRLLALFGADYVRGDWLTAWTLLDLFLLLVFALAVGRLRGIAAGVLAFCAFGLAYHEPGAPRFVWLLLLVPLALDHVLPPPATAATGTATARRVVNVARWACVALLVLVLVPFVGRQVQQALYPQLEPIGERSLGFPSLAGGPMSRNAPMAVPAVPAPVGGEGEDQNAYDRSGQPGQPSSALSKQPSQVRKENLFYDAKARIQTGPGVPEWTWRTVSFGWNGPVGAAQRVRPVLISLGFERVLTILRVALALALAAVLLDGGGARGGDRRPRVNGDAGSFRWGNFLRRRHRPPGATGGPTATAATTAVVLFLAAGLALSPVAPSARAQATPVPASSATTVLPDQETLRQLRDRLLEPSDAYPNAADLPSVALTLDGRRLVLEAEVHAALQTAVPLPGRLPAWSPVSVRVDDQPEAALRRDDGFLWVVVPPGVHRVRVEGLLPPDVAEWEWTYGLRPRQVRITAPGWTFSGVRPDGVPEAQVFFTRQEKAAASSSSAASYDRNETQALVVVDRWLELGLVWQVRSTVRRLTPAGKALALRIPLLPGENVFTADAAAVRDGSMDVRLGAAEETFTWESGLAVTDRLPLTTRAGDGWVERWHLDASPVWNVQLAGLPPVFEPANDQLVPVWQPWPGEGVELTISRPEAVAGAVVTVGRALHDVSLGSRQRTATLNLTLRASLGEDFPVTLPPGAEVTSLTHNDRAIPVRMTDGNRLVVPLRPGEQTLAVAWRLNDPLTFRTKVNEVRLPVESANVTTVVHVPGDRWTLATFGPTRGPAVRFWVILGCALIAAVVLARLGGRSGSPLGTVSWMLLVVGLTQVWLPAALLVVAWLFALGWRGDEARFARLGPAGHNGYQVLLVGLTLAAVVTLLATVAEGLLGSPEMFILGNGSDRTFLRWFQARSEGGGVLPRPGCLTVSVWWYRLLMLGWALWLAASLLRWLRWGWGNFTRGGVFRQRPPRQEAPPAAAVTTAVVPPSPQPPPLPVQP